MRKQDITPAPLLTYIRIREIFRSFLNYKYGDTPIDLPVCGSELYNIMSTGLVPNYKMGLVCYSSFSQAAYDAAFNDNGTYLFTHVELSRRPILPKEDDRERLLAFTMPRTMIAGGKRINTDKWFQLSNSSYKEFSRCVESEFWAAYIKHDQRYNLFCMREGRKYNQELSMEKFMQMVGMDFSLEETLARFWRRKKSSDTKLFDYYTNKDSTFSLMKQIDYY